MKERANIGLGKAISYFLDNKYNVSIPITETQRYDLVVEKNNKLQRVECKTTSFKSPHGIPTIALKTCGGNKSGQTVKKISSRDADILFAYDMDSSNSWIIPIKEIDDMGGINLGKKYKKYMAR